MNVVGKRKETHAVGPYGAQREECQQAAAITLHTFHG